MKIVKKKDRVEIKNSDKCTVYEYPIGDSDINGTLVEIDGRYPDRGFAINTKCKEIAYIIEGVGSVTINNEKTDLSSGDMVFIDANEKYFWEGKLTMFMPCTPTWYPDQHKIVN